jgi:hypothetical protein
MFCKEICPRAWGGVYIAPMLLVACSPVQQIGSVAAAGSALVSTVTAADEQMLPAPELRQLQTRQFAAAKSASFAGVMTVLLDLGYRVQSADLGSGLITATAPSLGRLRLGSAGLSRTNQTPVVSAFIEELTPGSSRVRVNFSVDTTSPGPLGTAGERAVFDAAVYSTFFTQLQSELASRQVPAPSSQPVQAAEQSAPPSEAAPANAPPQGEEPATIGADDDEQVTLSPAGAASPTQPEEEAEGEAVMP